FVRYLIDLAGVSSWEGTAAQLLAELEVKASEQEKRLRTWPKTARSLSGQLRRLAPNLRLAGISVDFERKSGGTRHRVIHLEKLGNSPSQPSRPSHSQEITEGEIGTVGGTVGTVSTSDRPSKKPAKYGIRDGRDGRDGGLHISSNSHSEHARRQEKLGRARVL